MPPFLCFSAVYRFLGRLGSPFPLARRADAGVAAVIFLAAAVWGGWFYGRFIRSGGRPVFYQSYFEPAVMLACGKGFLVAQPQPPAAVRAFLFERSDRFACSDLPDDLRLGTEGLYQRPWRYLMTAVAATWRVVGVSWSGLAPLFGVLFGATAALTYGLCRQLTGRLAAIGCAALLCVSPAQLANLPNLRDYAKAPFTVALMTILVALVVRPLRRRDVLLLSLAYGLVMGVGYGFRTDLLVDVPPFVMTVALFLAGGAWRNLGLKAAAVAVFAAGFVSAAWPILAATISSGGCQWHFVLLGLTQPFDAALGVSGGAYSWGHLYKDEYLWATVASHANRLRSEPAYIEYCSHQYDVASWQYLRQILVTFPADILTRAYAAALQVLDLPFQRVAAPRHAGAVLAAVFIVAAAAASSRLALFALFVIVYFGGHTAIQFLPRHYFPFEVVGLAVLAFLIDGAVRRGSALVRERRFDRRAILNRRAARAVAWALIVAGLLVVPLALLRWYQNGRVTRLLGSYAAARSSPVPLHEVGPGRFRLEGSGEAKARTEIAAVGAVGRSTARFLEAELDAAACAPGSTVTFAYDRTYPAADFSYAVPLPVKGQGTPARLFEPVYAGFVGIDVSDPSPACFQRLLAVDDAGRFPLFLPAQLQPGWESQPQYQRIVSVP